MSGNAPLDQSKLRFVYRPLLAVRTKAISTFLAIPIREIQPGRFLSYYDVLDAPSDPAWIQELDLLTLLQVGSELERLVQSQGRSLLAVPVHFESLASPDRRRKYVDFAANVFSGRRKRVIFEILGLSDGFPQARIAEIASALAPHGRSVIARFSPRRAGFDGFRAAGIHAVGVDAFSIAESEAAFMRETDLFAAKARRAGLKSYMEGVRSRSLLTAAICAGFDYAAGYAFSPALAAAEDIKRYRLDAPYRDLLDAARGRTPGR